MEVEENIAAIGNTKKTPIWPEGKTKHLRSVGTLSKPSIEDVLASIPNLVILSGMSVGGYS